MVAALRSICIYHENDLIKDAYAVLNLIVSEAAGGMDLDCLATWILRTKYTRLTTPLNFAYLVIRVAVHIADIWGLQRDAR